mmetsp:Transcript_12892/g.38945  ORF Transcript_12892/g.38945 Transcript_12892/m.38945 type:complete len:410 (+) Transcript_12892:160-1389(+)
MQCQHGHGVSARSSTADKLPKPIVPLGGCKWPAKSVSSCSCGPHRAITHLLQRPTQCFTATQSRDHLRPRLKGRGPSYTAAQSGKGSLGASTPTPPDSGQQLLSQTETDIITQRLVWLSAVFMVGSFMPDILSHAGAAASTAGAAPAWLTPLRGSAAFITLSSVFTEIEEFPAMAAHALGGVCTLVLLGQAVSAGQMAALPLQMLLGAAAVAAGLNTVHWRQMPDPSPASARQLRQWLWFIGCINCGLLLQALGGSVAATTAMGVAAAAATIVINRLGEDSVVRRKWGNMPALAATLLLVWDAAKPLAHPGAVAAAVPAAAAALSMATNACLVPRALSLSNTMFIRATSFFTASKWVALACMVATSSLPSAGTGSLTSDRWAFAALTVGVGAHLKWLNGIRTRFPHERD